MGTRCNFIIFCVEIAARIVVGAPNRNPQCNLAKERRVVGVERGSWACPALDAPRW
jgi:hypothetical protein